MCVFDKLSIYPFQEMIKIPTLESVEGPVIA